MISHHPPHRAAPPGCPAHRAAAPGRGVPFALHGRTLTGPELLAAYRRLRQRHGAVVPVTIGPGLEAWLVLGYREVLRVCRDERSFTRDSRCWTLLREGRVPPDSPVLPFVA